MRSNLQEAMQAGAPSQGSEKANGVGFRVSSVAHVPVPT